MKNKIENKDFLVEKLKNFKNATAIFWKFSEIEIAKFDSNTVIPELDEIKEMRVFDENKEIFVWRSGYDLFWRERIDELSKDGEFKKNKAIIRGSIAQKVKECFKPTFDKDSDIAILKHDYIEYNDVNAAGYVDSRFVKFITF